MVVKGCFCWQLRSCLPGHATLPLISQTHRHYNHQHQVFSECRIFMSRTTIIKRVVVWTPPKKGSQQLRIPPTLKKSWAIQALHWYPNVNYNLCEHIVWRVPHGIPIIGPAAPSRSSGPHALSSRLANVQGPGTNLWMPACWRALSDSPADAAANERLKDHYSKIMVKYDGQMNSNDGEMVVNRWFVGEWC